MKKVIIAVMLIFLMFFNFSAAVAAQNTAFILDKFYLNKSLKYHDLFYMENRVSYPIEVKQYGEMRVIMDVQESYKLILEYSDDGRDYDYKKTDIFSPVPPTTQYFPENSFRVKIFNFEKYDTDKSWEEWLNKGKIVDKLDSRDFGDTPKPLKKITGNDSYISVYYDVDFEEMKKTNGRYIVQIASISRFNTEGIVRIDYPGDKSYFNHKTEKYHDNLPDLIMYNVGLNDENELKVTIKNIGDRLLHKGYYLLSGEKAVTLLAKINGKNYGVTLSGFDPQKILTQKPGTEVEYTFENTEINKPSNIKLYIDYNNIVIEENKHNNYQEVELGGLKTIKPNIKLPNINMQE